MFSWRKLYQLYRTILSTALRQYAMYTLFTSLLDKQLTDVRPFLGAGGPVNKELLAIFAIALNMDTCPDTCVRIHSDSFGTSTHHNLVLSS
jgi:hypothetical protein